MGEIMELDIKFNPINGGVYCHFNDGENYYYADKAWIGGCEETMIFPTDKEGQVTSWTELYCDRSGKSLEECINEFLNK
jgi:hypothetical protein